MLQNILQEVINHCGMECTRERVLEKTRRKEVVFVRHFFVYCAREKGYSYPSIAAFLNRDHTTIIHSYKRACRDRRILDLYELILPKISGVIFSKEKNGMKVLLDRSARYSLFSNTFEKYGGKCLVCGFSSIVEICHIIPRSLGGSNVESNLIVLCPSHHEMLDRGLLKIQDIHNLPVR